MIARTIVEVAAIDCVLTDATWDFAVEEAAAIDMHWARRVAGNPYLFDGRILMLHHGTVEMGPGGRAVFRGACFETGFKAFMAWREFGFPPTGPRNIFAMAAIEAADGGFVLGEMAPHTAPAGQIYFPSGTPDRSDVVGDRVDIEGSAMRELTEETGLDAADVDLVPGMILVMDETRVCCMKRVRSRENGAALVARIDAWLAAEERPEFARMHLVGAPADIPDATPDFAADYLRHMFALRRGPSPA